MKRFLAVYIGTEAAHQRAQWEKLSDEERKALEASGIKAWMDWTWSISARLSATSSIALISRRAFAAPAA